MASRAASASLAMLLALIGLTGCTTPPEPEPTPTFATEEEAFAAAEATYRAYVDALNGVDLSDPSTFEDVYAWTTGEANAEERRTLSQMHADGWHVTGKTAIASFFGDALSEEGGVVGVVCSDVRDVLVVDSEGASVVSPERPDTYALRVTFVGSDSTETRMAIDSSNAIEDERCATP